MFFIFVLNLAMMILDQTASQLMSACCASFVSIKAFSSVCVCVAVGGGGRGASSSPWPEFRSVLKVRRNANKCCVLKTL